MEDEASKPKAIAHRDEWGITPKMEVYAQAVAKGSSLKEAYETAYDASSMSTTSIYTEASKLMDHPKVAARVRHLMDERAKKTHAIDAMRIRQHVFDRLMVESVDDDNPPAARIRSLELLGKIDVVSMFKEQKGEAKDHGDIDPVELEARLRGMLGKMFGIKPPE